MSLDKLLILRYKHLKVPKQRCRIKDVPSEILNNLDEVEKIYTLLYIHPCFVLELINENPNISPDKFKTLLKSLKPLYHDLKNDNPKYETLDNINLMSLIRIVINSEIDYNFVKRDISNLFLSTSYIESLIELYFYKVSYLC